MESCSTTHRTEFQVKQSCMLGMRGISEILGFVRLMREFESKDWGRIVHRVDASGCRAIMLRRGCGGLTHITVNLCGIKKPCVSTPLKSMVPRDEMLAHVLASPSNAEELRKTLTELNAYRDGEAED